MKNPIFEEIRGRYLKTTSKLEDKAMRSVFYSLLNEIETIVYKQQD